MGAKGGKPTTNEMRQWVARVNNFSSQYNNSSWSANCVIGTPRVYPEYGDLHGAWATKIIDANQFIEVEFEEKVYPSEINIYETYHAGAVKSIKTRDPSSDNKWITVWETPKVEKITRSRIFSPQFERLQFPLNQLLITVDMSVCGTWAELDAIELVGTKFNFEPPPPPYDLADDLAKLVNNNLFSDVTFLVEGKEFHGHKSILVVRSDFFRAMFCDNMKEKDTKKPIEFRDVSANAFAVMLHFMYTNTLPGDTSCPLLVDVWRVADLFLVEGMKSLAVTGIVSKLDINNVVEIYMESITKLPIMDDIREVALSFMKLHMKQVVRQKAFKSLDHSTMVELIECMTEDMSISDSAKLKSKAKKK